MIVAPLHKCEKCGGAFPADLMNREHDFADFGREKWVCKQCPQPAEPQNDQSPLPSSSLRPEDILHQVSVVITKDGEAAIIGPLDNLPLMLNLLAQGVDIVGGLVSQAIPKRIIQVAGGLLLG
jgi:hypothetical protein